MRKVFPIEDRIYIAKYYGKVDTGELAMGISSTTTNKDIEKEVARMKEEGVYELYKAMTTEEYEEVYRRRENRMKRNKFFSGVKKKCQK